MAGAGFWLPSDFLADDDVLPDNHNFCKNPDSDFCFPTDFPYHFSTRMTAPSAGWGAGNGSPSGVTSSVGDLICRLQLNGKVTFAPATIPSFNSSLLMALYNEKNSGIWNSTQQQIYQNRVLMAQAARDRAAAALLWGGGGGATAAKRSCAGTGVFLPRRYGSGGDGKKTVKPPLNSQFHDFARPRPEPQPIGSGIFAPDYDWMLARKQHVAMVEEPRAMCRDAARLLPQEWTY